MRIGELAGLVGISTRAIRHYHHVGLLAEPARTTNGYREYSLRDAVELARQEADLRRRRARLAQLLRQAEAGGKPSEQAPVSPGLAGLFDRMAHVAAGRPGPEPAMAAEDRDLMALLETASPARGTGWLDVLTRTLNSDPGAAERAYAVYACLEELADSEPARRAIQFPDGDLEETGFGAAFYADFAPAQAAAIRRAVGLMREERRAGRPAGSPEGDPSMKETTP
jgi:DNA-binding transcriptional MerR regulator